MRYLLLCILGLFYISTQAQSPLTVNDAITIGLRKNFNLQITKLEEVSTNLQVDNFREERLLPQINAQIGQQNRLRKVNSPTSFLDGFYQDNLLNLGLETNWQVYDGGRIKIDQAKLAELQKKNQGNITRAVENTIYSIQLAYYRALIAWENLKVIESTKDFSREKLHDGFTMRTLGQLSTYDVQKLENNFLTDSTKYLVEKVNYEISLQDLYAEMGISSKMTFTLVDQLNFDQEQKIPAILEKELVHHNQQLKNHQIDITLASLNTQYERTFQLPTLVLNGGLTQDLNSTKFKDENREDGKNFAFAFGFTLSYNVFNGRLFKRRIAEQQIQSKIEQLRMDELTLNLKNKLRNAVRNYNQQLATINIHNQLVNNLSQNLADAELQYEAGHLSILEWRIIQLELMRAKLARLETIFRLKQQDVEIAQLTGKLRKGEH